MPDRADIPVVRLFRRRYRLALLLVGLVFTGALWSTVTALRIDDNVAERVNVSGRQRMLSQRIAMTAQAAVHDRDRDPSRNALLLDSAITLMALSHTRLVDPEVDPDLSSPLSDEISELFGARSRMDERVLEYLDSARVVLRMVRSDPGAVPSASTLSFLSDQASGPLLAGLDSIVNQYQGDGDEFLARVIALQYLLWVISMASLALIGVTILRPIRHTLADAIVTARDREAAVRAMQHLNQVGFLAANVAHDLKNFTGVAHGNISLLGEDLTKMGINQGPVDSALESVEQIQKTARRLLTLSRPGDEKPAEVDLGIHLGDQIGLLRHAVSPVELEFVRTNERLPVRVVIRDLESTLLNLCSNARDALVGRPSPRITLEVERSKAGAATLSVSDNGPGIPGAIRPRIFEPFVTTKSKGKGTGLGLAQVAEFATASKGTVRVEAVESGGARFVLELPIVGSAQV